MAHASIFMRRAISFFIFSGHFFQIKVPSPCGLPLQNTSGQVFFKHLCQIAFFHENCTIPYTALGGVLCSFHIGKQSLFRHLENLIPPREKRWFFKVVNFESSKSSMVPRNIDISQSQTTARKPKMIKTRTAKIVHFTEEYSWFREMTSNLNLVKSHDTQYRE